MATTSSGPTRPAQPPHHSHQSRSDSFSPQAVHASLLSRQNSAPVKSAGKPSPYTAKAETGGKKEVRAAIGGPPKRRESLSGMGNNLRSHHHAGLGRSVTKSPKTIPSPRPPPLQSPPRDGPYPVHRRGSVGTASAVTSDASQRAAGPTVFPTNPGYTAKAFSRPSPGLASQESSQSPPPAAARTAQSPLRVHIVHRAHSASVDRRVSPQSAPSPTSAGLDIGSPETGPIVDIVGSPSRPFVVYASADKSSNIGGSSGGKQAMLEKPGLGGTQGKSWMADRPSSIGAPAPHDLHPESGLTKVLKSLSIGRKS
ncbi:hypothetical protein LPJ60_000522 [Coemansia sp. RSA 2675]|nr:hypothetical protein LPJ60_000522 [Coemansia sp. RSA 2675]